MRYQASSLKRKKIKIAAFQLKHDYFLQKNDLTIAPKSAEREITKAIRYRQLKQLKNIAYINNKLCYRGMGSVNCRRCSQGDMICFHLTNYCTRSCFFCPKKRIASNTTINYSPVTDQDILPIQQAVEWFEAKGCGLTGGDPLVVIDKPLHYIKAFKDRFGADFWIHLYTNGDLLTPENLKALKKAGLDEIRFNLAANGYNVDPVALAKQYIPKVLIEIPAIPEDKQQVMQTMHSLEQIGIDGMNLHELTINPENVGKMKQRKYQAKQDYQFPFYLQKEVPVYLSEELIFDVIEFAAAQQFSYSVHYCTFSQRLFGQLFSRYYKTAIRYKRPYETITGQGLLEKLVVSAPGIPAALKDLENNRVPKAQIQVSNSGKRLETQADNLKFLNPAKYETRIIRCVPDEHFNEVYIGDLIKDGNCKL